MCCGTSLGHIYIALTTGDSVPENTAQILGVIEQLLPRVGAAAWAGRNGGLENESASSGRCAERPRQGSWGGSADRAHVARLRARGIVRNDRAVRRALCGQR